MTSRAGFTLVEVMVALVLTGMVLSTGYLLFAGIASATREVEAAAQDLDRSGNQRAWLARAFAGVAAGVADSTGFVGVGHGVPDHEADEVRFAALLPAGGGERLTRLWLGLAAGGQVRAVVDGRESLTLAEGVRSFGIDYLPAPGANVAWLHAWASPVSAPVAVRLRLTFHDDTADTLLLPCGPLP